MRTFQIRANVLIVANFRGWAWDHKARNLRRELRRFGIKVDIVYYYDYCCDSQTGWHDIGYSHGNHLNFAGYDAVLLFSLSMSSIINDTLDMQRAFIGICSHVPYNGRPGNLNDIQVLNGFRGVFVLNRFLFEEFQDEIEHLYFCPNGVDTEMFVPTALLGQQPDLVIGWVGDPCHACDKGFYDVILPVSAIGNYHLAVADKTDSYRTYEQMPDFYNSIDVYVCASLSEGTPNPCLEAAACGRPILTTAVGNMPEFIRPGYNGFLIQRSPESLDEYLRQLNRNRSYLRTLGQNARNTALEWDWSKRSLCFVSMLSRVIPMDDLMEKLE